MMRLGFWLGLFLLVAGFMPRTLEAADIIFREKARVAGEMIRLEDIARINPRSDAERASLREILFGEAPASGQVSTLDPAYLRRRLEQFGFWGPGHNVSLPEKPLLVRRSVVRNRISDVEEALRILIQRQFDAGFSRVDVELRDPETLLNDLPKGLISVEAVDLDFVRPHSDETHMVLTIRVGDQEVRGRFPVGIRLWRREVHAARRLGMRLDIEETELKLEEVEVTAGLEEGCTDIREVAGHRLRRLVPENRRVLKKDILPELAIIKSQLIRLEQRSNGLSVVFHARALDDGRVGDELIFERPSGDRVRARVTGKGTALLLGRGNNIKSKTIVIGEPE